MYTYLFEMCSISELEDSSLSVTELRREALASGEISGARRDEIVGAFGPEAEPMGPGVGRWGAEWPS